MGYLSCKAHSSVSISDSAVPNPTRKKKKEAEEQVNPDLEKFLYSELEVATEHFSERKLLGRGSHGVVYKGVLPCGRLVAVKKASQRRPPSSSEFENELLILSQLRSPRLVNLLGYSSDRRLMVVEYMSNGTLYDLLHNSPKPPPNWGRRLRFALQIATALHTLHSQFPPVIHRDVKSANVLIDRNSNARLADFGLALRSHGSNHSSTPPAGTMGYLDPAYLSPHHLTTKTDVFSFGVLLLEIISGRKAIDVAHSPPSILDWAIPLIRNSSSLLQIYDPRIPPPKDPLVRNQLGLIAAKCVRSCTDRRPSMNQVVHALHLLAKLVPLHSWNGLVNPCFIVDAHLPLHSTLRGFECGNPNDVQSSKIPKRVYSDLGFRNNLKDLMDDPRPISD